MKYRYHLAVIIAVGVLLSVTWAGAQDQAAPRTEPHLNLSLTDAPIVTALESAFKNTPYSMVCTPQVVQGTPPVTVNLKEVPFDKGLSLLCGSVGLTFTSTDDGVYTFSREPDTVTLNNQQVPIVGALRVDGQQAGGAAASANVLDAGEIARMRLPRGQANQMGTAGNITVQMAPNVDDRAVQQMQSARNALRGLTQPPAGLTPPRSGPDLIDLEVSKMLLRDVVARFRKASGYDVVVHPAVPATIRVTARVYRVPAEWLLQTIAEQSGLRVQIETVTLKSVGPHAVTVPKRHLRYHVVPAPQITVVGAVPAAPFVLPQSGGQRGQLRRADPTAGELYLLSQKPGAGQMEVKPK
jgi:hypothetical protein